MQIQNSTSEIWDWHRHSKPTANFSRHHRIRSVLGAITTIFLTFFSIEISQTEALIPPQDSHHILAPKQRPSLIAAIQSTSESHRHSLSVARDATLQTCLNQQVLTTSPRKPEISTSTWVDELRFKYGNVLFDTQFYTDNADYASRLQDIGARVEGSRKPNFVIAQVSVVYKQDEAGAVAATEEKIPAVHTAETTYVRQVLSSFQTISPCYVSGMEVKEAPECRGWRGFFDEEEEQFRLFLSQSGHADIDETYRDLAHGHSEQALLGHLYTDAEACRIAGGPRSPSDVDPEPTNCVLYAEAIQNNWVGHLCNIKLFVVDIISAPNSVCQNCDISMGNPLFANTYTQALNAYCRSRGGFANPKVIIRTAAVRKFQSYLHASCAGLKHPDIISPLLEDNDPITLHLIPDEGGRLIVERCKAGPECELFT